MPAPAARGGPVATGTVTGEVTCDRMTTTGPRLPAWTAGALVAVALLALVTVGGIALTVAVLLPLLPALLVLAALLIGYRVLLFGFRRHRREQTTEVRRFRITEVSGRVVDCELTGELQGAQLRRGDIVEVYGRQPRQGPVRPREIVIVADQARVRARPHLGFVLAHGTDAGLLVLACVCVAGVGYALITR